jgi:hypothetical protein
MAMLNNQRVLPFNTFFRPKMCQTEELGTKNIQWISFPSQGTFFCRSDELEQSQALTN